MTSRTLLLPKLSKMNTTFFGFNFPFNNDFLNISYWRKKNDKNDRNDFSTTLFLIAT